MDWGLVDFRAKKKIIEIFFGFGLEFYNFALYIIARWRSGISLGSYSKVRRFESVLRYEVKRQKKK